MTCDIEKLKKELSEWENLVKSFDIKEKRDCPKCGKHVYIYEVHKCGKPRSQ